jgi:hypothetical protein
MNIKVDLCCLTISDKYFDKVFTHYNIVEVQGHQWLKHIIQQFAKLIATKLEGHRGNIFI